MRKNIWIINQDVLTPKYGYMQHRHFFIASELVRLGYNINILTSNFNHFIVSRPPSSKTFNFEKINDVNFCWIRGLKYDNPNGLRRILSWLYFTFLLFWVPKKKVGRPDTIIFSSTGLFPILAAWYYKVIYKAQIVLEIRDIWPMTLIDIGNISSKHPLVRIIGWLERFAYKKADHIVGTMPNLISHVRNVISTPPPFTCIPQGIDKAFLAELKSLDPVFEKEFLSPDKFIIGYAGTIGRSNVLEDLIDAGTRLYHTDIPNIQIVFLGDGARKAELQEKTAHLPFIKFAPKIPKAAVNAFLEKCHLLFDGVFPAKIYDYGLSRNKWIDYMYSARPIIVSYSGYLSMLNEAKCGEAVPVHDINELVNTIKKYYLLEKTELDKIGQRGKEYILQYRTIDKLAYQYHGIISRLANTPEI